MLGFDSYNRPIFPTEGVHHALVGGTGTGKTTLLEHRINTGQGFAFIGYDADSIARIVGMIPNWRANHVIYIDPSDPDWAVPIPILPLNGEAETAAQQTLDFLREFYKNSWGVRLEWVLSSMIRAVLFSSADIAPPLGLASVYKLLASQTYRDYIGRGVDVFGKHFFDALKRLPATLRNETILPVLNKVGRIMQSPDARATFCQPFSRYNLAEAMDRQQIIILDIASSKHGDMGRMYGAAFFTAITREAPLRKTNDPYYLCIDEVQEYAQSIDIDRVLGTSRKHGLFLIVSTTNLEQVEEKMLASLFANSGVIGVFRTSAKDAERLAKELGTDMQPRMFQELPMYSCLYARRGERLIIRPEIVRVQPPRDVNLVRGSKIRRASLRRWGRPREQVLQEIERHLK